MTADIQVYVRLDVEGRRDTRSLGFRIPQGREGFTTSDLLEAGFAVDGNEAVRSVRGRDDKTMIEELIEVQKFVVRWFEGRDMTVEFV